MDALAEYGSDEDSSVSSSGRAPANNVSEKPVALSSLLAYSDDDDGESSSSTGGNEKAQETSKNTHRKRKRGDDDQAQTDATTRSEGGDNDYILPPPPLANSTACRAGGSLIQWDTDYTKLYRMSLASTGKKNANNHVKPELVHKLSALANANTSTLATQQQQDDGTIPRTGTTISWAQHLKSQHEFHNPHFFQNVVSHFGIQEALGSNLVLAVPFDFQLYEYDLPAAEEQARIRQEQERQEQEMAIGNSVGGGSTGSSTSNARHDSSRNALEQHARMQQRSRGMSM